MLNERIDELTERLRDKSFVAKAPQALIKELRRQLGAMKTEYDAIDRVLKKLG